VKAVIVDVRELDEHSEKYQIQQAFEKLGWTTQIGQFSKPTPSLETRIKIDYYRFTWWDATKPVYPKIPDNCNIFDD